MPSQENAASFVVRPQSQGHVQAVETLLDMAFGPGRFAKASYRLRERVDPVDSLSFVAEQTDAPAEQLAGSIRYWPVRIGPNADGVPADALLLGPLAVAPGLQGKGVGLALMETSLEAARAQGHKLVLLVGDLPYYRRAGFCQVPLGQVTLPQPYNPERLLWRALVPGAEDGVAGVMHRPE